MMIPLIPLWHLSNHILCNNVVDVGIDFSQFGHNIEYDRYTNDIIYYKCDLQPVILCRLLEMLLSVVTLMSLVFQSSDRNEGSPKRHCTTHYFFQNNDTIITFPFFSSLFDHHPSKKGGKKLGRQDND
jgi:hypothetical protein